MRWYFLVALLVLISLCALLLSGCPNNANARYHQAQAYLAGKEYQKALDAFDQVLVKNPESKTALFGKARCTYELGNYADAQKLFEDFLTKTEQEKATYSDERYDAAFYRDKCKQALGEEVPQDPADIPPPPMGE